MMLGDNEVERAPMSDGQPSIDAPQLENLREELDAVNRKLEDSHKMASLGRLVAGIVHEINTPIGSILSNNEVILRSLEALKKQIPESAKSERLLETIDTLASLASVDKIACERILSVIRSLKTFARVEERDLRMADMNELLRNTLKLWSCEFRRRVALETDFGDLPEIECHPQLLSQVFLNIMVNAAQAIDGEGKITVRTRPAGEYVDVSIADTGRGIPAEIRGRIFSSGFTTKAVGVGTGLGLKISREIVVDTHGGTLDFESEPGKGTTFHIHLPLRAPRKNGK
jgi:two-component system, NtrC family, sensor kinase